MERRKDKDAGRTPARTNNVLKETMGVRSPFFKNGRTVDATVGKSLHTPQPGLRNGA
jgi:hypothetical protein